MVKRRKSVNVQKKQNVSASDSETEYQRPKKVIKTKKGSVQFSSTPHSNSAPFFDGPSTSSFFDGSLTSTASNRNGTTEFHDNPSDCNYANFTSFLESHSFISDDESDLLTVSRLAEKKPSTPVQPIQNNTSRRSMTCLSNSFKNASLEFSLDNLKVLTVPPKNLEIILAQHPASITLHGYLKMTVLVGTVSVLGYDVKADNSVHIFSSKRSGYKKISTKLSAVRICPEDMQKTLKSITEAGEDEEKPIQEFVDCIGSFSSVFVLENCVLPPPLKFLELYFPNAVEMDIPKKDSSSASKNVAYSSDMYSTIDLGVIEVSPDAELIAKHFNKDFLDTGPRILVHGASRSGKSTMLRYLIHTVLNTGTEVFYLDTDPGQTEFTPPGVISLIKVTKPLLGPPFTHQRNPIRMIFTGSVTPASSPPFYIDCVHALIDYFDANFHKKVLFVNTMGWVEGIGDECFQSVKAISKPTMLIDFLSKECSELRIDETQDNCIHVKVPIKKYPCPSFYSAKDMREFALMSYLGKCQKYYMKPQFLNEFRPACVKWDDIAISVMGKRVEPTRLIEAIHCSIVALCHVDETQMLECDNPELPKTLQDEAMNECLGFGLVRAADETNHILYIVTPLPVEKLVRVNSLIKGKIVIPDLAYLKQPIFNTPIPYTAVSKTPPASIKKNVKKRQFIPQQTPK